MHHVERVVSVRRIDRVRRLVEAEIAQLVAVEVIVRRQPRERRHVGADLAGIDRELLRHHIMDCLSIGRHRLFGLRGIDDVPAADSVFQEDNRLAG